MDKRCPGASTQRTPTLVVKKCPACGKEIEVFSNDECPLCEACGYGEDSRSQTCYQWCRHAQECRKTTANKKGGL